MTFYCITLMVTLEQETTIQELFCSKGWIYRKADAVEGNPSNAITLQTTDEELATKPFGIQPVALEVEEQKMSVSDKFKFEKVLKVETETENHLSPSILITESSSTSSAVIRYKTTTAEIDTVLEKSQSENGQFHDGWTTDHCSNEVVNGENKHNVSKRMKAKDRRKLITKQGIYCKDCDHTFSSKERFDKHLNEDNCAHTCEICGCVFLHGRKFHYLHHMKRHHKQLDHKCKICGKSFVSKGELNYHMKAHNNTQKPGTCEQCGATFTNIRNMQQHRRVMHNINRGKFECPHCSRLLASKDTLRCHIRHMHTESDGRPFSCHSCQKTFKLEASLKQHEKYHTLTKKCKCDQCGASFKRRGDLTLHKKRHAKEYSFFCKTCGKGFHDTNKLKFHENIHSGQKPYKCDLCDYRCACKSNLPIHMKRVHLKERDI